MAVFEKEKFDKIEHIVSRDKFSFSSFRNNLNKNCDTLNEHLGFPHPEVSISVIRKFRFPSSGSFGFCHPEVSVSKI